MRIIHTVTSIGIKQTTVRALIFALGHFLIDITVISSVTSASYSQTIMAALLSPFFNTIWYWILDYVWTNFYKYRKQGS